MVEMTEDYLSRVQTLVDSLEDIFGRNNHSRGVSSLMHRESQEELEGFEVTVYPAKSSERTRPDAAVNES